MVAPGWCPFFRHQMGHYHCTLVLTGPADKLKMDFGDIVTAVDVEQTGRSPKELVYPIALLMLGGILWLQLIRRRKEL